MLSGSSPCATQFCHNSLLVEQYQNIPSLGNITERKTAPLKKKKTSPTFLTFSCLRGENMEVDEKESKEMEVNVGGERGAESGSEIQHTFTLILWE